MNDKWLALIWTMVIFCICVITITLGVNDYQVKRVAFENGYEQQQMLGTSTSIWAKANNTGDK